MLLPVLDDSKHYWVDDAEIDKLIRAGGGWLAAHPERDLITHRYLAHQRKLAATAVARLAEVDDTEPEALDNAVPEAPDDRAEAWITPAAPGTPRGGTPRSRRHSAPVRWPSSAATPCWPCCATVLRDARRGPVADLGCGEGSLVALLLREPAVARVLGVDVSHRALERAAQRLHLDTMPDRQRDRVDLLQSSLTYADDAAGRAGRGGADGGHRARRPAPARRAGADRVRLGPARHRRGHHPERRAQRAVHRPGPGAMRHPDHRFEWTRPQFRDWAAGVAGRRGYQVRYLPVGPDDPEVGPPTQLAVFTRA